MRKAYPLGLCLACLWGYAFRALHEKRKGIDLVIRHDMLVGYFFFSGVKVMYDALKARPDLKVRMLVGMDAEIAMGRLLEDPKEALRQIA